MAYLATGLLPCRNICWLLIRVDSCPASALTVLFILLRCIWRIMPGLFLWSAVMGDMPYPSVCCVRWTERQSPGCLAASSLVSV